MCSWQHSSPTAPIEPHPFVHHTLHRPDEKLCHIGASKSDDLSDAFILKELVDPWVESTLIIAKNRHHFFLRLMQRLLHFSFIRTMLANLLTMFLTTNPIWAKGSWRELSPLELWLGFHIFYVNLILQLCDGCSVGVWTPVFSNRLLGNCLLLKCSTSTLLMVGFCSFAFLRVSLIETETCFKIEIAIANDVIVLIVSLHIL